jgi:hypothetical protein
MYEAHNLSIPGIPQLPKPDLALNTGDNVYFDGAEGSYWEFWMPVWNNDISSNETGAPFIRHIPYYIVAGNHDLGSTGISANPLGSANAGQFSGGTGGGDALQYFNNYCFPLNGPKGVDVQNIFNGDSSTPTGFYFKYNGVTYNSPTAIEAFRASTAVDTGKGTKRQIDAMGNYSFDQGNAHFVFLDGNSHLFDALLSYTPSYQSAPNGREVVITIGRLEAAETRNVHVEVKIPAAGNEDAMLVASASVRSATAMPVHTNDVRTRVEGGHKHAVSMNEEHK